MGRFQFDLRADAGDAHRGSEQRRVSARNERRELGADARAGFTYTNQLLTYVRDEAKADDGSALPIFGSNTVVMDLNTIAWTSTATVLGGAQYSASATFPNRSSGSR